jgi:ribosome biogenesis GTPase / thiamine phosphate phosphatase
MPKGKIIKALSGFYYVQADSLIYQCRGRGIFRKQNVTPLVGDHVDFESTSLTDGTIVAIEKRKNELNRPPIANVDQALLIFSAVKPDFDAKLLDRFLVHIEARDIQPTICITKMDLADDNVRKKMRDWQAVYDKIGYSVHLISSQTEEGFLELKRLLRDKTTVIAGQSGVGKSSLVNALDVTLSIETNAISESLGRGKHTTRHVELLPIEGGFVADTPGFSSLEFNDLEIEGLDACFPELSHLAGACKFRGCTHRSEPGCAVKKGLENGEVAPSRYNNYLIFFEEIASRKRRY